MNVKLVSKENMGGALLLLLLLIISQSRIFDFFFQTALGRALFIVLLLIISYCNKILGVVTVLIIILMINRRDFLYYEGFTDASGNTITDASGNPMTDASGNRMTDASGNPMTDASGNPMTDASGNNVNHPVVVAKKISSSSSSSGTEGFDLLGTENTLKRGKKSNTIPVSDSVRRSGNVDPYSSSSSFDNSYSMF
jgi:hypothetical protein